RRSRRKSARIRSALRSPCPATSRGELFNVRFGFFERLLGVVAIGGRDRLNAALQVARGSSNRFEMLFAVVLNVFNLDHHGVLSQTAGANRFCREVPAP